MLHTPSSHVKFHVVKLRTRADYAYGDAGSPPKIPGGATLDFEVELISWKSVKDIAGGWVGGWGEGGGSDVWMTSPLRFSAHLFFLAKQPSTQPTKNLIQPIFNPPPRRRRRHQDHS